MHGTMVSKPPQMYRIKLYSPRKIIIPSHSCTNDRSWMAVANMLFLESPAGVGFSYSNTTSDYDNTGDTSTAADAYTFLTNWLERFPEYKGRDFFITGESYGGHYIPQLANAILSNNNITNVTIINLKGVAVSFRQ